ncbi:MAG TPA: ATP-binding protein [Sorangium sp.]|uniref:ATP-binding protein n=1 Tax=Sorangium sp. So ce1153 TaxID=3133333 RepID=UPI002BC5B978|nr:ATP-binding protein [Sorangium sp.]
MTTTMSFPGVLDSLSHIRAFARGAAMRAGLDERGTYRLCLAVDEVATNIITHGYAEAGRDGTVVVSARLDAASLTLEIEDTGARYDPAAQPMPTEQELAEPPEVRRAGGLGLFLVFQSVSSFRHEHIGSRNRTTLVMQLEEDRQHHGDPS